MAGCARVEVAEQRVLTARHSPRVLSVLGVVALAGALGALARWSATEVFSVAPGTFPWTTFAINVVGSYVLALLPAIDVVRRNPLLAVGLGPGLLGGFTTLSGYSEESRALVAAGHTGLAAAYLLGTLGACLVAVQMADRWSTRAERRVFADEGGDE